MEPTNADIMSDFLHHAEEDHKFQVKSTETSDAILKSLDGLHEKLGQMEQRLDSIETKIEPLVELYNGFVFGNKALKWLAGVIGAILVITGAAVAMVKFLK